MLRGGNSRSFNLYSPQAKRASARLRNRIVPEIRQELVELAEARIEQKAKLAALEAKIAAKKATRALEEAKAERQRVAAETPNSNNSGKGAVNDVDNVVVDVVVDTDKTVNDPVDNLANVDGVLNDGAAGGRNKIADPVLPVDDVIVKNESSANAANNSKAKVIIGGLASNASGVQIKGIARTLEPAFASARRVVIGASRQVPKGQGAVYTTTTPGGTKTALPLWVGYSPGHQGKLDDEQLVVPSRAQEGYDFDNNPEFRDTTKQYIVTANA
jgi:hypothetical protein